MDYLVGIDLGTSNVKTIIISEEGEVVAISKKEYEIDVPAIGYAEQDPEVWWYKTKECIAEMITKSEISKDSIIGIGITGQMHGTVPLDRYLKPIRKAVIWIDRRSQSQCIEFYNILGKDWVIDILGNPIMPGFMGPTLLWLKENEAESFRKIYKVSLPKDYIGYKLTGEITTDFSDASATLLFDNRRRKWSEHILTELNIEADILPDVYESVDIRGEITWRASEETGLPKDIPVITGGGDSPVGAIGAGVIDNKVLSSNIGTGGQILLLTDECKIDRKLRVHSFIHVVPGKWYLQGATLSAGLSLRWFRNEFGHLERTLADLLNVDPYDLIVKEAEKVEPGSKGLVFLPYLIGERSPYMDPDAKGVFFGLTIEHSRAHFIRAIMEGVVFALRDCLEVFRELGVSVEKVIARGGGSRSRLWRQIQADIYGLPVLKSSIDEDAAFGAALLAGVGVGLYPDIYRACKEIIKLNEEIKPNKERQIIYEQLFQKIYRHLYPLLKSLY